MPRAQKEATGRKNAEEQRGEEGDTESQEKLAPLTPPNPREEQNKEEQRLDPAYPRKTRDPEARQQRGKPGRWAPDLKNLCTASGPKDKQERPAVARPRRGL